MINNVVLVGRLTKDIELKYTQGNIPVTTFTVAVNRNYTNQDGNREADYINCVAWRKNAEILKKYTRKGFLIGIHGRIQTRSYENTNGQRIYLTEVIIDEIQLLENKNKLKKESDTEPKVMENNYLTERKDVGGGNDFNGIIGNLPFEEDLPF